MRWQREIFLNLFKVKSRAQTLLSQLMVDLDFLIHLQLLQERGHQEKLAHKDFNRQESQRMQYLDILRCLRYTTIFQQQIKCQISMILNLHQLDHQ